MKLFSSYKNRLLLLSTALHILASITYATTWDEPWHDQVVRNADLLAKVRITSNSGDIAKAKVLKVLAGSESSPEITLQNYSALHLVSFSVRGELALPYKVGEEYFLLVKRDPVTGFYQTPTPTSGWAEIHSDGVYATYRHSYHKALVPIDIYELTTVAIFKALHGETSVDVAVLDFIRRTLAESPANLEADVNSEQSTRFFRQHVALETFGYIGTGADLKILQPFIATSFPQVEISAARAIGKLQSLEADDLLMRTIEGDKFGFAKIMCVWALLKHNARNMIPRLEAFLKKGKDEETGFGGSIMDPRISTAFPGSVKKSVVALLETWKPTKKVGK